MAWLPLLFWPWRSRSPRSGRGRHGAPKKRQTACPLCVDVLEERTLLSASLVRDINPGSPWSGPEEITNVNGTAFFPAVHVDYGRELWKSDGTEAGTVLVKDIFPGTHEECDPMGVCSEVPNSSMPFSPLYLVEMNGVLFFRATDGVNGVELWRSDGTEAGTVLVKDIYPGPGGSFAGNLTNVNGTLFFWAIDPVNGRELWRSDGTEAGTVLVKDINPGPADSSPGTFGFREVNGILFFDATSPGTGRELWKSDGTEVGTVLVKDINPGSADSTPGNLLNVGETLFFAPFTSAAGRELWRSDGTEAGTVLVKDINPGSASSFPDELTAMNGTLFFKATNPAHGYELWKSDGTEAGTVVVKDIMPGTGGGNPFHLTNVNETLFFSANGSGTGFEPWKSDGTEAGTVLIKDINPGSASGFVTPGFVGQANGVFFFMADDGLHGWELWRSDGTEAGTVLVADIWPGSANAVPRALATVNGTLYFAANDGTYGQELWQVTNAPPVLAPLADRTVPSIQQVITVPLSATDPDGDTLTFTVTAQSLAYVLNQQYAFTTDGDFYENAGGQGEKWVLSGVGLWYFILPNGELYEHDGGPGATGTLLGNVGTSYWVDPFQLLNAPADEPRALLSISGTALTITRDLAWVSSLVITVTVSDGQLTDSRTFTVSVTL